MAIGLFITGTGTDIGKTHATLNLMRVMQSWGLRVLAMKPVAAGARQRDGCWVNDDGLALREAGSLSVPYEWVNPYALPMPVSPHIAAAAVGEQVDLARIQESFVRMASMADCVLVEGVGGWRVPLNAHQDVADLALLLGLPVVMVVGLQLGCINYARLTEESIRVSGARLGGWVANQCAPDLLSRQDVLDTLSNRLRRRPLAELPFEYDLGHTEYTGDDHWNRTEILRLIAP